MATDLKKMTVEELIKLQAEIESLIIQKQKEKKTELRKMFKDLAEKEGLTIDEVLNPVVKGKKESVFKYMKDSKGWSGKGRRPAWVLEILEKGEKLEDYEMK